MIKDTQNLFKNITEYNEYVDFEFDDVTITIFDEGDMGFEVNYDGDTCENIVSAEAMIFIYQIRGIKGWD